jgi:hypothetical protein
MSDLSQRLRLNATIPLVMEAADRIEALEAVLREVLDGAPDAFDLARAVLEPEQDK